MCGLATEKATRGIRFGERVKAFRKGQGMTGEGMGKELGYSRSYVKAIEGGSLQASEKFKRRFYALERRTYRKEFVNGAITSRYVLPSELVVFIRPRRCPICKRWMIAPAHQVTCDRASCKREHAAAQRRARTRKAKARARRKAGKR